jgi:hypothetical protein
VTLSQFCHAVFQIPQHRPWNSLAPCFSEFATSVQRGFCTLQHCVLAAVHRRLLVGMGDAPKTIAQLVEAPLFSKPPVPLPKIKNNCFISDASGSSAAKLYDWSMVTFLPWSPLPEDSAHVEDNADLQNCPAVGGRADPDLLHLLWKSRHMLTVKGTVEGALTSIKMDCFHANLPCSELSGLQRTDTATNAAVTTNPTVHKHRTHMENEDVHTWKAASFCTRSYVSC